MRYLFLSVALLLSFVTHAEIYKWVDESGRLHFRDSPPREMKSEEVTVKPNIYTSPTITTTSHATASEEKKVVMYSTAWCGICKKARRYFRKNRVPFVEYDVEQSSKGRRDYKKLQGRGVPIILVGDRRMNGFSADRFESIYRD